MSVRLEKNKPFVYISSPYTNGDIAINVRCSFDMFSELLEDDKVIPYSPLVSHFIHLQKPQNWRTWMIYDLELIKRFDCLLVINAHYKFNKGDIGIANYIEYWKNSKGVKKEIAYMNKLKRPIFMNKEDLYGFYHV